MKRRVHRGQLVSGGYKQRRFWSGAAAAAGVLAIGGAIMGVIWVGIGG